MAHHPKQHGGRVGHGSESSLSEESSSTEWVLRLNKQWQAEDVDINSFTDNEPSSSSNQKSSMPSMPSMPSVSVLSVPAAQGSASASAHPQRGPPCVIMAPIVHALLQSHRAGVCDPCVFFNSARGCRAGRTCPFCHLDHPKVNVAGSNRPRKVIRDKIKERIEHCLQGPQDEVHACLQEVARDHAYARCLVRGYLDEDAQGDLKENSPTQPGEVIFL
ncbi:unnamed protein product [Cladocopium goreaui]|uniref:C3H1-type domain-containing protein n=1 Tax=Cladocopium goreaui TaxID=2562237 RepID=A0A9P1DEC9_9DINO|nr:unnamed protein product [Cladocopium goreaui]